MTASGRLLTWLRALLVAQTLFVVLRVLAKRLLETPAFRQVLLQLACS